MRKAALRSRNLKKPEARYQVIQSKKWKERPTAKNGFTLIDVTNTYTEWGISNADRKVCRNSQEEKAREKK